MLVTEQMMNFPIKNRRFLNVPSGVFLESANATGFRWHGKLPQKDYVLFEKRYQEHVIGDHGLKERWIRRETEKYAELAMKDPKAILLDTKYERRVHFLYPCRIRTDENSQYLEPGWTSVVVNIAKDPATVVTWFFVYEEDFNEFDEDRFLFSRNAGRRGRS